MQTTSWSLTSAEFHGLLFARGGNGYFDQSPSCLCEIAASLLQR